MRGAAGVVHVRRELADLRLADMAEVGTPVEHDHEHVDLPAWAVDAGELHEPAVSPVEPGELETARVADRPPREHRGAAFEPRRLEPLDARACR